MKRVQGGKVVDYDPFTPEVVASKPTTKKLVAPEGSVSDVLEWVGDDPDRARAALEAEYAKDVPRSTLVDKLS